jgi:hypothetical protein
MKINFLNNWVWVCPFLLFFFNAAGEFRLERFVSVGLPPIAYVSKVIGQSK